MRTRLVLAALVMALLLKCAPASASGAVLGVACPDLGATTMAADHTAILLCAFPTANAATNCASGGGCVWAPMSGSDGPPGTLCGAWALPMTSALGAPMAPAINIPCKGVTILTINIGLPETITSHCPPGYALIIIGNYAVIGSTVDTSPEGGGGIIFDFATTGSESEYSCVKQ